MWMGVVIDIQHISTFNKHNCRRRRWSSAQRALWARGTEGPSEDAIDTAMRAVERGVAGVLAHVRYGTPMKWSYISTCRWVVRAGDCGLWRTDDGVKKKEQESARGGEARTPATREGGVAPQALLRVLRRCRVLQHAIRVASNSIVTALGCPPHRPEMCGARRESFVRVE